METGKPPVRPDDRDRMIQRILSNAEETVILASLAGEGFIGYLASMLRLEATGRLDQLGSPHADNAP
jgi:hypothetical protein